MTIYDFIEDITRNAPVERAGNWLLHASAEYPELFRAITDNLDAPPSVVLDKFCQQFPAGNLLRFLPHVHDWIQNLQAFFKNKAGM